MNINLLDLLNQMKKFTTQEKGDFFSLLMYIFLSFILLSWYFSTPMSSEYTEYNIYITLILLGGIVILWYSTRRIDIVRHKINIGIAQFNILNTSIKENIDSEKKIMLSNEISNYIYNSLNHESQILQTGGYTNFFRLPSRINIDYSNVNKISSKLGSDIIVRGTIIYTDGIYSLNYKVSFKKRINSIFFDKLINDINAYPDILFDFSNKNNLECDKFIHMVSYLSLIYKSIEYMNNYKFEHAESILSDALYKLNNLYNDTTDQSVNIGDKDMVKIEILMYFIRTKNYLNRANHYIENFDYTNEANKKLELCTISVNKQISLIETYLDHKTDFSSHFEEIQLQKEYVYSIGQLGKTKNKEILESKMDHAKHILGDAYEFDLIKAFIETIFKDFKQAKSHYETILRQDPKNRVALRGLGMLYYEKNDIGLSYKYLKRLYDISHMHIFQTNMYDIKLQKILIDIAFKKGNVFLALVYYIRSISYKMKNLKKLQEMYTI